MKRTIIAASLLTGLIFSFLFTQSSAKAESSSKQFYKSMVIFSDSPNSGGSISGPEVRNFTTDANGDINLYPIPQEGYYCICVTGTGGGCLSSVYFNGFLGSYTVNNNATCICGD